MTCGTTIAMPCGETAPVIAVICDPANDPPGLTFFTVVFSDAPPPEVDCDELVCAHCLIDDYPEVGRGLDLAKQLGDADGECVTVERDLDTGEWRVSLDEAAAIAEESRRRRRLGIPIHEG